MLDSMNGSVELFAKQMLSVWVGVYYYERCIIFCALLLFLLCYYSQRTAQTLVEDDKKLMFGEMVCSGSFCSESSRKTHAEILLMWREYGIMLI